MPKGDAEKLKADTEDGYTRIADLLLEALIAAPLTAIELRTILFVIRRTYGWAKQSDPNSGKADVMTAEDIAKGLCVSARTVERPLTVLVRNGLLLRMPLELEKRGVRCAYGVNTHLDEWGSGPDWALFRAQLREAQQAEAYTQASVVPVRWIAYRQYAEERTANTLDSVVREPAKPTAATVREPLIDSSDRQVGERNGEPALPDGQSETNNNDDKLQQVDTCNNPVYSAAWHYWKHNGNPPKGRENWCRLLVMQADNAGVRKLLDDDAIVAAFRTSPPRAAEWPDGWLERLCKERLALARQDPAAATDPAIAECIRRHGPKPEDQFLLREWGEWLKGIRAELAGQEAAL